MKLIIYSILFLFLALFSPFFVGRKSENGWRTYLVRKILPILFFLLSIGFFSAFITKNIASYIKSIM